MSRKLLAFCATVLLALAAGNALAADSIKGRLGVTGRIGFSVPADSDINGFTVSTDTGFIGGGGFIYGITDNIAAELDVTHATYGTSTLVAPAPFGNSDFDTTNVSLGVQYRFLNVPVRRLVPYVGAGLDILVNDASTGGGIDADTVVGVHLSGGVDYFFLRQLAFTAEMKGVLAPNADIHNAAGQKIGNYDPDSFSMTFGVRYFFN
ncbi:MAG TPA: outer membrane beta-barrel protein [Geobacteraceae bacterium]